LSPILTSKRLNRPTKTTIKPNVGRK